MTLFNNFLIEYIGHVCLKSSIIEGNTGCHNYVILTEAKHSLG